MRVFDSLVKLFHFPLCHEQSLKSELREKLLTKHLHRFFTSGHTLLEFRQGKKFLRSPLQEVVR